MAKNPNGQQLRDMHLMIDHELARRAEQYAKTEDMSLSQVVRRALRKLLATAAV